MKTRNCTKLFMVLATAFLCLLAGLFVSPVKTEAATKATVVLEFTDGTKVTWKTGDKKIELGKKKLAYVYFGEYPQTEVTGKQLTKAIKNAKYDKNGIAKVKGVKYKRLEKEETIYAFDSAVQGDAEKKYYYDWAGRTYTYFKIEPIKWRVLSNKKGTLLLLSEYALNDLRYHTEWIDMTWEDCYLRTWLNDTFLNSAFNAKEKKLIKKTTLTTADNPEFGTAGGNKTKDKIYLLSREDVLKYNFSKDPFTEDSTRICYSTDFAMVIRSAFSLSAGGELATYWWLRSPGCDPSVVTSVSNHGDVDDFSAYVVTYNSVRPALQLNLSSVIK